MRNLFIKSFLLLFLIIIARIPFAQERDSIPTFNIFERLSSKKAGEGEVKIITDSRLESVMRDRFNSASKTQKGWRIRVYRDNSQNGRASAEKEKGRIMATYANLPVYINYTSPYWYVTVGDYYTRESAEKMKRDIITLYLGASLIESTIFYPKYE